MHDVREAYRALRSTPIVTAAAVISLALGIGANTAIFSILNSLLLRPLPVHDPHGLVAVGAATPGQDADLTYPVWSALRDRQVLDGTFAWARDGVSEVQGGETRPINVIWASGRFFDTLGVKAIAGRTLDERDDRRGGGPGGAAAVLSAAFWQRRFDGEPSVVGRTIVLDRVPFAIAGVAIGLYGVTSHWVWSRRREIGVRIALGAAGSRVARLVLRRLTLVALCGVIAGGAASLAAGRLVESLLFGVGARDPLSFALAAVTLFVTAALAGWLPARRAARIDPMIVLREP